MDWIKQTPVLVVDDSLHVLNAEGLAVESIMTRLGEAGLPILEAVSCHDAWLILRAHSEIGCLLLDWDLGGLEQDGGDPAELVARVRDVNPELPIFVMTERLDTDEVPTGVLGRINGFLWKTEDTPEFIAGRIEEAVRRYHRAILPPFFSALLDSVRERSSTWHTPGHGGGVAFLKSPTGRSFYEFMGENVLRADHSAPVPELGSPLEHSGPVGEAERRAARSFGADRTSFVSNGASAANKIVWQARLSPGDVVLVDRNCHASIIHAMVLTRAVPVYLAPSRNDYGIVGPVHPDEIRPETVRIKLEQSPLIPNPDMVSLRLAMLTNSTWDGLCYDMHHLLAELGPLVEGLHCDEAWYAYAAFHPLYSGRYAMDPQFAVPGNPALFATQSSHKLLAALSQGAMVHVKDHHVADEALQAPAARFNEAFRLHSSASPQYGVIASLDVATRMMQGVEGRQLMADAIAEAVAFRRKMRMVAEDLACRDGREEPGSTAARQDACTADDLGWWFSVWQPDTVLSLNPESRDGHEQRVDLSEADPQVLATDPRPWTLQPGQDWHPFQAIPPGYVMLDPIKVTVICPGIRRNWSLTDYGIPAAVVRRFLHSKGIVVEATGHYAFLALFSLGVTKGKSGSLLSELFEFKRLHDAHSPLELVFPELVRRYPARYRELTLPRLCADMHDFYRLRAIPELMLQVYARLPEQAMIPAQAYEALVRGRVDTVGLDDLIGRVSAVTVTPSPPGVPAILPGERFTLETSAIMDYLRESQAFDAAFPGFENEVQGIERESSGNGDNGGDGRYTVFCLKD